MATSTISLDDLVTGTLDAAIAAGASSATVNFDSVNGSVNAPSNTTYWILVDFDSSEKVELIKVTGQSGSSNPYTLTLGTRGVGPTNDAAHSAGAKFKLVWSAAGVNNVNTILDEKANLEGATMTGLLQFSGTGHAGLQLNSLTTTQRDALSATNGMHIYNSTDGQVQWVEGGSWVSNASGGSVANASDSVAGKAKLSVAAATPSDPIAAGTNDPRIDNYAASSAGSDTYAITLSSAPSAYAAGQKYAFKADVFNTGACTLNVNSLGAKAIKKYGSLDLHTGDIHADQLVEVIYDGTNMQLLSLPEAPVGVTKEWYTTTAPTGWLLCDGAAISMTTYEALFLVIGTVEGLGSAAGTFTADAGTDLLTDSSHGLSANDVVQFTNSGGALPTGLSADTNYWVISDGLTANDFKVSTSRGGSAVDITGAGSGTHSYYTTFLTPDMRGRFALTKDNLGGSSANRVTDTDADTIGNSDGAETVTLTTTEMPAHTHTLSARSTASNSTSAFATRSDLSGSENDLTTDSAGSGSAFSIMNPFYTVARIIKY